MLFSITKIKPLCVYLAKGVHPKEATPQLALAVCQRPLEEFSSKTNGTEKGGSLPELFNEAAELGFGKRLFGYRCVCASCRYCLYYRIKHLYYGNIISKRGKLGVELKVKGILHLPRRYKTFRCDLAGVVFRGLRARKNRGEKQRPEYV